MSIKILQPGLFSTIQDEGRIGYQDLGFSGAGALDFYSFKMAQKLIGNDGPAIEYTVIGPKVQFLKENTFAFIGGTSNAKLNGNSIDSQVVYKVQTNDVLEIGQVTEGARGYLVFGHPLKIERIAASYSTHTRSGLGGFEGRALKKHDIIPTQSNASYNENLGKATDYKPLVEDNTIHVIKGPQFSSFSEEAVDTFINSEFKVSDQSDRMGYRLVGPSVSPLKTADIISEPVALGSIQVPNDGNPIILLNDKQTVGGYTKIATVTQLDLKKLAQLKPGETIRFEWISTEEAFKQLIEFENDFDQKLKNVSEQPLFNLSNVRNTSKKLASLIKEDK
ncbi:biotin-dependent carboxyltransferase family protein [Staphylococcus capitis]|uniref:5-oxoprolinase subunit C family protein n=1 Tax=Staphylococcus capitis TaxID=29388 RepID=UPI001642FBC8|nr:biotin-dependent carboxyltransferase family protein [Staphylococcus capitis]MBC3079266.1 biotin-dependent carboxyltransferase family protein [Staphylococcus capitis]